MNVKISVFVICVEAIIYLLLYNLHDCAFKLFYQFSILLFISFPVNAFENKMDDMMEEYYN